MLSLEDLADLGDALREAGFRIALQQFFDAQQLLMRLDAAGALPQAKAELEPYLAPLFCKSAIEQQRFSDLYGRWARRGMSRPEPPPPPPPKPKWRVRLRPLVFKLAAATALLVLGLGAWQHYRPRFVEGVVLDNTGRPVANAEARLGKTSAKTDGSGKFRLTVTAGQLPATVIAMSGRATGSETIGRQFSARPQFAMWQRLYLYATDWSSELSVTLSLFFDLSDPLPPTEPVGGRSPTSSSILVAQDGERLAPSVGLPTFWQRVDGRNVSAMLLPLLLFGVWAGWRFARRPALRRIASRTPAEVREVHLPGGVRALLPGLPLRRLAQELRRRRLVESNELQPELTIRATLRRGGVFTPVRGSRVEPEYLALVDRASLSDHQGLLADHILTDLARSDVLIERYDFDGDAERCRRREPFDPAARRSPSASAPRRERLQAATLAELRERHPDHRVLVFSDGAGCFDGFSGEAAPWLETLLEWPSPVLITPLPPERWSRREWALEQLGLTVLPMSQSGMLALMGLLGGAPSLERGEGDMEPAAEALHDRSPSRWLERGSPDAAVVERLCSGLRGELGERGFSWLAGCAAYPEIHWGITLRLAAALVPERGEIERLLPRVAGLPWFREGFMPDWLRKALLSRMDVGDENLARDVIRTMLESVTLEAHSQLPLRIAIGALPAAHRVPWRRLRDAWRRLIARDRLGQMLSTAPPESPMRDVVFLQFVNGERIGGLSLRAPGALLRTLFGRQRRMVSRPITAFIVSASAAAVVASAWPPIYLGSAEPKPIFVEWDHAGSLIVTSVIEFGEHDRLLLVPKATWVRPDTAQAPKMDYFPVHLLAQPDSGAMSRDGNILAVGYKDGKVMTVTAENASARRFAGQTQEVKVLAFSDDSGLLASGAGKTIVVWDLDTAVEAARIDARSTVTSLAFAPGGRLLAAGGDEGSVRVWRVGSFSDPAAQVTQGGRSPSNLAADFKDNSENPREITALAYSADGKMLASGNAEGTTMVWDMNVRRPGRKNISSSSAPIMQLAFQPAGTLLAAMDNRGARLWDPRGGAVTTVPGVVTSDRGGSWIAFSPDGQRLATLDDAGGVKLYRVSSAISAPLAPASSTKAPSVFPSSPPGRGFAIVFASERDSAQGQQRAVPNQISSNLEEIAGVLKKRFALDARVLGGSSVNLLSALDQLVESTTPQDQVLIYLSGIERQPFNEDEIMRRLAAMPAREVLVVAHSQLPWPFAGSGNLRARTAGAVRLLLRSPVQEFPLAFEKALVSGPPEMTAGVLRDMAARLLPKPSDLSLERLPDAGDSGGGDFVFVEGGKARRRPAAAR